MLSKNQGQISKKRCVGSYCSFDKACQFLALQGMPCGIYLEKQTMRDKYTVEFDFLCIKRFISPK